jgi:L-rhamnose isomerase/sugar isomerase
MSELSPQTRTRVSAVLRTQRIETASWAFANSGTRF